MPLGWTRRGFVLSEAEGWAISLEGELEANKWTQVKKKKWKMEKWKNEFQNPGIFDTAVFDTSPCACTGTVAPGPQRRQAQIQQPAQTGSFEACGRSRFISTAAYGFLSWAVGTLTRGVGLRLRAPLGHINGSSEYHQIP